MTLLKKSQFASLANKHSKYCISFFLPTQRAGENKESIITLKNQVKKIEGELMLQGLKPAEIKKYLDPVIGLLENPGFWRHLSDALVIFRNSKDFYYTTLPIDVKELSVVSDRFYLLPLLSLFNNNDTFFILTLSMKKNRLYEATQHEIAQIETDGVLPENIAASTGYDFEQKLLQFRSGHARSSLGLFHSKGEGKDNKK